MTKSYNADAPDSRRRVRIENAPLVTHHREWIWTTVAEGSEYVAIDTLCPVTVSEVDVLETWRINGHGTLVVIDEPEEWWRLAQWEVPEGPWAFPKHRVVGEQFSNTSVQLSDVPRAH